MTKAATFSKAAAPPRSRLDPAVRAYLATNGRKGGSVKSEAKRRAARRAAKASAKARSSRESVAAMARKAGISRSTVAWRIAAGWPLAKALGGGK